MIVPLIIASALFLQNLDATVLATAVPALTPHDFIMPFAVIAVICMASGLAFAGLPADAAAHVSRHPKPAKT